jgi:hypothetical protein
MKDARRTTHLELSDNPDDLAGRISHNQMSDTMLAHQFGGMSNRIGRLNRHDMSIHHLFD